VSVEAAPPVVPNLPPASEVPGIRRIGRNTFETLLFRGLSTPVGLLLVVVQSRFLHPSGRGAFVLAVLSVTILSRLLGQLGAGVVNRLKEKDVEVRGLVHRALGLALALSPLGALVILAWAQVTADVGITLAALAAAALLPNVVWQTLSGVLLGLARVRLWNVVQLLPPLLTLAGMLILVVWLDRGVRGAVLAWGLAHLLTAAFALAATRELWLPLAPLSISDAAARAIVRLALVMGAVQVVNLFSYRVELYILRAYEGLSAVGVYSIAMQAAESMWLVAAAVATAVTAPVVHDTEERAARLIARASGRGLLMTAGVAIPVGLAAPLLVPLIFGAGFSGAAFPLALLLPGVVAYAPVSILVVYLSIRRERPRLSLAVSVVAMIVTTALALVLVPRYGASGAGLASSIGYLAGAACAWGAFVRLAGRTWLGRRPRIAAAMR